MGPGFAGPARRGRGAGHLFVPTKFDYVRGKRPQVECILCEVSSRRDTVDRLEVHRAELSVVTLNLHPYNPGHLMIFPKRHLTHPVEFTPAEVAETHRLQLLAFRVLEHLYRPAGFNVGYNLGRASGASIEHYHLHVVPRYEKELGFMDIIGGAKILVEDPVRTRDRVREAFGKEA
jgi:ATP adenylyltransferase